MKNNQKGFGAVEAIFIVLVIGVLAYSGYYFMSQRDNQETSTTPASNSTTEKEEVDENATGYTIDFPADGKQKVEEVSVDDFKLTNRGGGVIVYNKTASKFQEGYLDASSQVDTSSLTDSQLNTKSADNTDIYSWGDGDAGWISYTYLVVLKDDKILKVTYDYNEKTSDETVNQPGAMTEEEMKAQKAKDLAVVKTFRFN